MIYESWKIFWGQHRFYSSHWSSDKYLHMLDILYFHLIHLNVRLMRVARLHLIECLCNWIVPAFLQFRLGCLLVLLSSQPVLVTLSKQIKGHMIRRGRTLGLIQQPGPVCNTWAPRTTKRNETRESLGLSVCVDKPRDTTALWKSFHKGALWTSDLYANTANCIKYIKVLMDLTVTVEMSRRLFECAYMCLHV